MNPSETISYEHFAKLDLRVGTILEAEPLANADRLLRLQIDLGGERRQVCAGIRRYYDATALVGRQVVVVANLEPREIRGEMSNGMLLAATVGEGKNIDDVVLLGPMKPVPAGSKAT